MSPRQPTSRGGAIGALGGQLGRHSLGYATARAMAMPFALLAAAVYTRTLVPEAYGELAVLLIFAGLLTVLFSLGTLQGTFAITYGASVEEEVDESGEARSQEPRRALTTGLLVTSAISTVGTLLVIASAELWARVLLDGGEDAGVVRLAAVAGGVGAIWRLVSNIPRVERRPAAYVVLSVLRPALVVAAAVALLWNDGEPASVVEGTIIGTAVAIVAGIAVSRRSFDPRFDRSAIGPLFTASKRFIPILLTLWIVQNTDALVLSLLTDKPGEVGLFRFASRIASVVSLLIGAFLMAWMPLQRSLLVRGSYRQLGTSQVMGNVVLYFVITSVTLVLFLAFASDSIVRIGGPEYRGAANLVPAIAGGYLLVGLFLMLYRCAGVRHRRWWFVVFLIMVAAIQIGASVVLVPVLGSYGPAAAMALGSVCGCAAWVVLIRARSNDPVRFPWRRLGIAVAWGAVIWADVTAIDPSGEAARYAVRALGLVLFALGLLAFGVIPRRHFSPLLHAGWLVLPQSATSRGLVASVLALPPRRRAVVEALTRDGTALEDVASGLGLPEREVAIRLARSLMQVTGSGHPSEHDEEVGRWLAAPLSVAERDREADRIVAAGVDPLVMHDLEDAYRRLGALPGRAWRQRPPSAGSAGRVRLRGTA
jgi:O-antigen/teichoic acid export membrane protein